MATVELEVIREAERAAVLMEGSRQRVLEALLERPDSAVGLARRLGESRQRLNYHLRVLEEAGLVELAEERPRRGVKERVMRVVARGFVVDPGALGRLGADRLMEADRFSVTYVVALASRAIRELAKLMARAGASGKRLPTAGLSAEVRLAEPSDFNALVEDLARAVGDVVAKYHSEAPEGRTFRLIAGSYPGPAPESTRKREATA